MTVTEQGMKVTPGDVVTLAVEPKPQMPDDLAALFEETA
jgi:hypothetical protein